MQYLVTSAQLLQTKQLANYHRLNIKTESGNIQLNVWGMSETLPVTPCLVNLQQPWKDAEGFLSTNGTNIEYQTLTEDHPLYKLLPQIPKKGEVLSCLTSQVAKQLLERLYPVYVKYPAATSIHHAYKGGLMVHTYEMVRLYNAMRPALFPHQEEIMEIALLMHDFGKVIEYTEDGVRKEEFFLLGHIYIGARYTHNYLLKNTQFSEEYINRIVHCILGHHGKLEWGSPVAPATYESFLCHHIDMISGHGTVYNETPNMGSTFGLGTIIRSDDVTKFK